MKESPRDNQGRGRSKFDPVTQLGTCTRCGLEKHISQFPAVKRPSKYGFRIYHAGHCKDCEKVRHREWAQSAQGKKVQSKHGRAKWNKIKKDPARHEEHRRATREWQRENGKEYRFFKKILPLLK